MKFGLFGGAQAVPGDVVTEAALGYHEYGDYIRTAEKLGFESAWLVEHHFTGFAQLSATLNYISFLAGITSTIRLGSAVVVVPWHNPILLAEHSKLHFAYHSGGSNRMILVIKTCRVGSGITISSSPPRFPCNPTARIARTPAVSTRIPSTRNLPEFWFGNPAWFR